MSGDFAFYVLGKTACFAFLPPWLAIEQACDYLLLGSHGVGTYDIIR